MQCNQRLVMILQPCMGSMTGAGSGDQDQDIVNSVM